MCVFDDDSFSEDAIEAEKGGELFEEDEDKSDDVEQDANEEDDSEDEDIELEEDGQANGDNDVAVSDYSDVYSGRETEGFGRQMNNIIDPVSVFT